MDKTKAKQPRVAIAIGEEVTIKGATCKLVYVNHGKGRMTFAPVDGMQQPAPTRVSRLKVPGTYAERSQPSGVILKLGGAA